VLRYAAFTDHGRGGNPAGMVLDSAGLDEAARLAVAARVGYSETAFAETAGGRGQYRIRYFSPKSEVAFCGHATIATAVAIAGRDGPGLLRFDTLAGPVAVRTSPSPAGLTATLTSVPTRTRPAQAAELAAALAALARRGPRPALPGTRRLRRQRPPDPRRTRPGRLATLDYDYPALDKLMAGQGWTTVHLVQAENPALFHARDPSPPGGVVEDPATGAAAAAFGGYLRALALIDIPARVTILQGEDMGRPAACSSTSPPATSASR
jgi:predicted PhzF superfamily epimerase YddE/YHI9